MSEAKIAEPSQRPFAEGFLLEHATNVFVPNEATLPPAFRRGRARGGDAAAAGDVVVQVPVLAGRRRLRLSQEDFAETFGLSVASVRNWEQGRRVPGRATRLLLRFIEDHPEAALASARAFAAEEGRA